MGAAKIQHRHAKPPRSAPRALEKFRRDPQETAKTAEYIADMAGELARLAGAARLPILTYFLNMARMEAESHLSSRS